MAESLVADGISKAFGGIQALRDVSITVDQGNIVGLIGPNGSGKSTFVNCVTGWCGIDTGKVECGGTKISGLPPDKVFRQGVARTFQTTKIFQNLNVLDNVRVALLWRTKTMRDSEELAMETLRRVGLESKAYEVAGTQSHFDKKRLEIAARICTQPKFLLLDEPAGGLTSVESNQLIEMVGQFKKEGLGVLLIEHTMKVIMSISDTVVVLDEGRKIAAGNPTDVAHDDAVIEAYLGRPVGESK